MLTFVIFIAQCLHINFGLESLLKRGLFLSDWLLILCHRLKVSCLALNYAKVTPVLVFKIQRVLIKVITNISHFRLLITISLQKVPTRKALHTRLIGDHSNTTKSTLRLGVVKFADLTRHLIKVSHKLAFLV